MRQALNSLGASEGMQEGFWPLGIIIHILACDMGMVQQFNESPHPNPLKSLVIDEFDEALNESSQPRRERNQVVKANKVLGVKAE